jgi:mycothiol S-conjugate amidase
VESILLKAAKSPLRLFLIFAHPDDESFGPAGTIIHYSRLGVAVHYVCATRGEAGHVTPELLEGYPSLSSLRTEELKRAAELLGITGIHFLDYQDSGMENTPENNNPASLFQAPLEEVAAGITGLIRTIRPQVIITFDPSGGYFHPDHIKIHQAATMAYHASGQTRCYPEQLKTGLAPFQPRKLYYTAFPRRMVKLLVKVLPVLGKDPTAWGRNRDINLLRIASVEQTVTTKIRITPYYEARRQAMQCHQSQLFGGGSNLFPEWLRKRLFRFDRYTRIVPPFGREKIERDLFAGIGED